MNLGFLLINYVLIVRATFMFQGDPLANKVSKKQKLVMNETNKNVEV